MINMFVGLGIGLVVYGIVIPTFANWYYDWDTERMRRK